MLLGGLLGRIGMRILRQNGLLMVSLGNNKSRQCGTELKAAKCRFQREGFIM